MKPKKYKQNINYLINLTLSLIGMKNLFGFSLICARKYL